jgi:hypothetical protein
VIGYAKLIGAGVVLVLILAAWGYGRHQVTVQWERDKAIAVVLHDAQVRETQRVQGEWNASKEREHEWKAKADAAGTDAAAVARRLRQVRAASCSAVPEAAAAAGDAGSPAPESADIGGIEERYFGACAADATDFDSIRAFYKGLVAAQSP